MSSYNILHHPCPTPNILPYQRVVAPSPFANATSNDTYFYWAQQQTLAMGLGSGTQQIHQQYQTTSTPYHPQGNITPYGFATPIFPPSNYTSNFSLPEPRTSHPNRIQPHPNQSAPCAYQASVNREIESYAPQSMQNNPAYCFSQPLQSHVVARPTYMQEIEQLNNLKGLCRLEKVTSLNAYTFGGNKIEKWQQAEESYADLVKRLLFWSNLKVIKGFALKGIVMTPTTFNKTLSKHMDAKEEEDFINTLLNKWLRLSQYASKDGVREFNTSCHIEALREINIHVLCI